MISGLALLQSRSQRRFQAPLILRTKLGPLNQLSFFLCAVGQLRQADFALSLRRKSGILDKLLQAVTTATKGRTNYYYKIFYTLTRGSKWTYRIVQNLHCIHFTHKSPRHFYLQLIEQCFVTWGDFCSIKTASGILLNNTRLRI